MFLKLSSEVLVSPETRVSLPTMDFPRWVKLSTGRHLGYCKGVTIPCWYVRLRLKEHKYQQFRLGTADDVLPTNGIDVLSYTQAVAKANDWARQRAGDLLKNTKAYECEDRYPPLPEAPPYTVAHAIVDYLKWYEQRRNSYSTTFYNCRANILPQLGAIPIQELEARTIRLWIDKLAATPARLHTGRDGIVNYRPISNDPETIRKRCNTVNRSLRNLKAALNRAYEYGYVEDPTQWRRVQPFKGVNQPRTRYLELSQCRQLVDACPPALRNLVMGALLTGCRISELREMLVEDFLPHLLRILISKGKGERQRHVAISAEGIQFFTQLTLNRDAHENMFVRDNGTKWTSATYLRPFHNMCVEIGIDPPLNFHALRHTYATQLAMAGVSFEVLAKQLGHKDTRMVQRHYAHLGSSYVDEVIQQKMPRILS